MAITTSDFALTTSEFEKLNRFVDESAEHYALAGEDPGWSVRVVFEWAPGVGRSVTAYFDASVSGLEICK